MSYLAALSKWMTECGLGEVAEGMSLLGAVRDRGKWKDMYAHVLKAHVKKY